MTYPTRTSTCRFAETLALLAPAGCGRPVGAAAFAAPEATLTGGFAKRRAADRRRRMPFPRASFGELFASPTAAYRTR